MTDKTPALEALAEKIARLIVEVSGRDPDEILKVDWECHDSSLPEIKAWECNTNLAYHMIDFFQRNPLQPVSAELVAWRYKYPGDKAWQVTQDEQQAKHLTGTWQPLYTSPPDQCARIRELEAEVKAERNRACNAEYMRDFCRQLLGPVASEVVESLITDGVMRVHVSWGPEAMRLTGEQRAAQYRAFSNAPRTEVKFDDEFETLNKESNPS